MRTETPYIAPLTARAAGLIADRHVNTTTAPQYDIFATADRDTVLCTVNAVDANAAIGLALGRRNMRFYLRHELGAR